MTGDKISFQFLVFSERTLAAHLKLKNQIRFCSPAVALHLSLLLSPRWQISAGELFELMLPASFTLTVLLSTWVLWSTRSLRFKAPAVILWTLGTLFFPFIILPLYLIARSYRRRREKEMAKDADNDSESSANEKRAPTVAWRRTLPLAYLILMLSLGALYFYTDSRSVDSHLARANQARVQEQRERVIKEYRAALALEDDAHTHNLLGKELAGARRWDEALAELSKAERMGEPDDELPYNIAEALYNLQRDGEAAEQYKRFLDGTPCKETPPNNRCAAARERLKEIAQRKPL